MNGRNDGDSEEMSNAVEGTTTRADETAGSSCGSDGIAEELKSWIEKAQVCLPLFHSASRQREILSTSRLLTAFQGVETDNFSIISSGLFTLLHIQILQSYLAPLSALLHISDTL